MREVTLRGTAVTTSQLGFGCAGLTSFNDRARAVRLLDEVFDTGIRHFDAARLYGLGHAEGILGDFLSRRRADVTVTTKLGLEPPSGLARHAGFVSMVKSVIRRFPPLAAIAHRRVRQGVTGGSFAPAAAARSLEKSLSELRTNYVDVLLLHEATLTDARRDDLLRFLDDQLSRGTARAIGIGSDVSALQGNVSLFPDAYQVFQFQNSAVDAPLTRLAGISEKAVITHSAVKPFRTLQAALAQAPKRTAEWSVRLGVDLADPGMLANELLRYAMASNPDGVTLFSSTKAERIRSNVEGATARPLDQDHAIRFAEFARAVTAG